MGNQWKNWSGSVQFEPHGVHYPTSEDEVCVLVRQAAAAGQRIRVVGAAHSFTPLISTDQLLISLDRMSGLIGSDKATLRAWAWAGTRLKALGALLHAEGLAMENLGDIDVQSIAGALSTGTHGTGVQFGTLSTQLRGITLVDGLGELRTLRFDHDGDDFKAAQISLGALGIITRVEIQAVPSYKLTYVAAKATLSDMLANLDSYKSKNRNFECYYFPFTETCQTKELNVSQADPDKRGFGRWFNDMFMENGVFSVLSNVSRFVPGTAATVSKISAWGASSGKTTAWSHQVFATPRLVRFQEMEFNIPQEHFKDAMGEIVATIRQRNFRVHFPLECRWVKGDDILISPAHGRDSAYIAAHMYKGMPYKDYFETLEAILKRYGGRPHWGKMHTFTSADCAARYPRWADFQAIRARFDPQGIFLNAYLERLFGVGNA
jgi:FAD-linked oxidoreductase